MSFKIQARVAPLGKKTITRQAKAVLWQLSDMANDDGMCFPSQDLLSYRAMLGETALREALSWLQDNQLIQVQRRQTGGRRFSDQYILNVTKITEMFVIETGRLPTAELPADLQIVNPQNPRVSLEANPQNTSTEPSESEGCYIEESIKINYQNNIQTVPVNFVSKEIEAWLSNSPLKGINTNSLEFIKACDLGICLQDMQDAFGYMQANSKGTSWNYFVKTLLSCVTDRLSNHVETSPIAETKTTKTKAKAANQKFEAGVTLLESNGVDDKKLIHDFMALRESKNAGVLTQSALDTWVDQAKTNGLAWSIQSIIRWCTGSDRFTFHGPMAAASVGGVKPTENQKMEALVAQIKSDIEHNQKPKVQEPRKPRPSLMKTLESALSSSKTAAFL